MRALALVTRCALYGAALTTTVACGGGGPSQGPSKASATAQITTLGPATIDGCSFGLAFDIQAPVAIGTIGIAPLAEWAGAPTLSLYAVDAFGNEQIVAKEASSVTGSMATLLSRLSTSDTSVAGDNASVFSETGQSAAVGTSDAFRNGTSWTTSESGSYARDSYGDQTLLADSLAAAGWSPEPVSHIAAPLVASSLDANQSSVGVERGATAAGVGESANGSFANGSLGTFDQAAGDSSLWANRSVDTGIGRLNVREAWGSDNAFASQQGADAINAFGNNAVSSQGATNSSFTAQQSIEDALAFSALDTLNSRHFVLRLQGEAVGGAAGVRVFQGTESLLFATEDAVVSLPACGN